MEFGRGLVQEVVAKLETDMPALVKEDSIMAHLIDELLLFEHELLLILPPSPTPLQGSSDMSSTYLCMLVPAPSGPVELAGDGVADGGGGGSPLSVLHVLLQEVPFDKWRQLEQCCEYLNRAGGSTGRGQHRQGAAQAGGSTGRGQHRQEQHRQGEIFHSMRFACS